MAEKHKKLSIILIYCFKSKLTLTEKYIWFTILRYTRPKTTNKKHTCFLFCLVEKRMAEDIKPEDEPGGCVIA